MKAYKILFLLAFAAGLHMQAQEARNNISTVENMKVTPLFFNSSLSDGANLGWSPKQQHDFFKAVVEDQPMNADLWLNYYRSERYYFESLNDTLDHQGALDSTAIQIHAKFPGSFQENLVEYWNADHDMAHYASLKKAYKVNPSDPDVLRLMCGAEYINGDLKTAAKYVAEWNATGELPSSLTPYAYNVLQSVAENAILITNGEYDTYPILAQQIGSKVRSDVKVVSIALCKRAENRAAIFRRCGLLLPANDSVSKFNAEYIRRLALMNPGKKIYLASTVSGKLLNELSSNLYLTGLASRYGSTEVENLDFLRNNVGVRMNFDFLSLSSSAGHTSFDDNAFVYLNMNYVLPLAIAAERYDRTGNPSRAAELRVLARRIGVAASKLEITDEILAAHQ